MNFNEAKLAILEMADSVNAGTFTQSDLTTFVLAFRFELFQTSKTLPGQVSNMTLCTTCSCGSTTKSCMECGPGYTTGFHEHNDQMMSFKIKKE